jgi:TRAP-type mannitol/chloroaromatic compound transport system substrate-binding protein
MEIKELLNEKLQGLGNQIDSKIEEALEAQKANLNNQLDNLKANELSHLTNSYNKLQEQVDSIETSAKRNSGEAVAKNWVGSMIEQIKGSEDFASQVRSNKGAQFNVPMFKTGTVLTGTSDYVDSTTSNNVVAPDYQPGIVFNPDRAEHVRQFLPQGVTTSDLVRYI